MPITGTGHDPEPSVRLPFSITAILLIGVIAADGAEGQPAAMRCERRSPPAATEDTSIATAVARSSLDAIGMPCAPPARSSHSDAMTPSLFRVVSGIGLAAAVAQASHAPEQWPQTTVGLFQRLADRSGAVAVQALAHHAIGQRLGWLPSRAPCPTGVLTRVQCAMSRTLVVRNTRGAPRPDVARIAGLTFGSAGSLLWRPERHSGGEAALFVLTRVGSGLAFATLRHAVARGRTPVPH